jgi:hypothetical protein
MLDTLPFDPHRNGKSALDRQIGDVDRLLRCHESRERHL